MNKTFLILAALLCCCFALRAQDFTYEGLNYRVTGTNPPTVELKGHTEGFAAHDFVIPSTVDYGSTTYSVTSIGDWAFQNYPPLTGSLTIPNSVTSIGREAFIFCEDLTGTLTIGNSVTSIGNGAFFGCTNLTGPLTIGSSVTSIGNNAFKGCSGFNGSLTIPNSVTSIGNSAFKDCSGFTGNLIIPNSLESIGNSAFEGCSGFNGELILGMSVVSIGDYAFKNNQFSQIVAKPGIIPATGTDAFYGISELQSVFVPCGSESDYEESWSGLADKIKENFVMNDLIVASSNPDYGSVSIIKYSDCESGLSIVTATPAANCMFRNWTENGVEVSTDNPYTFTLESDRNLVANFFRNYDFSADCSTGQTLYYRIIDAEQHTVKIVAPNSDDWQGWNGFTKPTGEITLPATVTNNSTSYTVTAIGNYAFRACDGLTDSLTIPNSVTSIGNSAFYNCSGFTGSLTIPNSVTSIGDNAFDGCSGFTGSLIIPDAVTSIGTSAFSGCEHFTGSLVIPDAVTSIGNYAFQNCKGFNGSLTIGNAVTSIGQVAFNGCSGFTGTLTIGSSVSSIENYAFANCSGFTHIIAKPDTPPTLGTDVFFGITELPSITVPCDKDDDYKTATGWSSFADNIADGFVLYDLNVASANISLGSASITQSATCRSQQVTVTAASNEGSLFINWTENGEEVSTENPYTFTLESDRSLVANFAAKALYNITVSASPDETGTATATVGGEQVESAFEGTEITVSATPNEGYKFVNWTENGEEVSTANPYIFNLESDRSLVANFAVRQLCHITVSVTPEGTGTATATMGGEPVESALEGSEITVSATHAEGYMFLNWTENGRQVSTSSTYTFTLESDRNLVANFTQYTYAPITSLPGPTTDPVYVIGYQDGDDFYLIDWGGDYESPMHLSKNPDNPLYYHFDFESGETYKDFTCAKVGHYYYLKIEEGHAFVSTFFGGDDERPYMIELSPNGDIFSYGSDNNALYHDGDIVKTHKYYLADNLRFFRLLRYFPVIVSASPAEGGTVSATCDGHEVTQALEGSTVTVTATPAEGYMFKNWTEYGRVVSTDNPYSFGIGGYCNLVANFVEPQYDFSAICETGQTLYYRITDAEQHLVSIVAPLGDDPSGWGSSKPEGNIVLPQTVIHDGIEYVVTEIGDYAFHNCRGLRGLLNIPVTVTRIGDFAFCKESGIDATLSIPDHVTSIGASAFKSRFIESIYIGNSVESIGSEALYVFDNTDRHVVSKAQTPPDFEGGFVCLYDLPQRIYIHIPKNTLAAYQSAWGDQYNYIEMNDYEFRPGMYDMWSFWENWSNGQHRPELYDNVTIQGNCLLDVDATVSELRVAAGKTLTIGEGKTLTAVSIILENGAQLINNGTVNCDNVTVKKAIEGYGEDMGDWYLVSSPVTASARTSGMATAPATDYDLYRFSQAGDSQGREWLNYKAGAFLMENQSGYLYASKDYTTIVFRGSLSATETKELEYVEGVDFPGFNLVGNPFPCNATISGTGLRSSNYFYKMNAGGTALEVVANPIIAPCTGVFAVAANSNATVTFAQASEAANVTRGEKSSLQDIRVELLANGKTIDRAFLNMNGESLPKFSLQDNTSEICFHHNEEDLAVASTDATRGVMPLNFKAAKTGTYTLTANAGNAALNYLHLVDNMTGDDIDLFSTPSHTFNASVCDDATRFKLVFGTKNANPESDFAYISNGEIVVSSDGRATLLVIDMLGRVVGSHEINGEGRVSTQGMAAGVYVLNLNGMTQKIVVR